MTVIVSRRAVSYDSPMAWKLLALIAFVLMPFGMATAPAAAQEAPTMAMIAGHCDEQPAPAPHDRQIMSDCAMCTALPAMQMPLVAPIELLTTMAVQPLAPGIDGIIPEIVPPPPKLS